MDAAITFAGDTHPGRMRRSNEDNFYLTPLSGSADHAAAMRNGYLFIVADGVGGNRGGARAGEMAVNRVPAFYYHAANGDPAHNLRVAFNGAAHEIVAEAVQNPDRASMSCTVVAAVVKDGAATIAHLGDARAYLWHGGALRPLTSDHTWVQMQVEKGTLTPEEALNHPDRNVITKSMGNPAFPEPTVTHTPLQPGDRLLLCSDGLSGVVPDAEIAAVLGRARDPGAATKELIDLANRKGGPDNVTAVVVQSGRALPAAAPRRSNSAPLLLMLVVAAALMIGGILIFRPSGNGPAEPTAAAVAIGGEGTATPDGTTTAATTPGAPTSTPAGVIGQPTETLTPTLTSPLAATQQSTTRATRPAAVVTVPSITSVPPPAGPPTLVFPEPATCSPEGNSRQFRSDEVIEFRWLWQGQPANDSFFRVKVGPLDSQLQDGGIASSSERTLRMNARSIFREGVEQYQWLVAYVGPDQSEASSLRSCFRIIGVDDGAGDDDDTTDPTKTPAPPTETPTTEPPTETPTSPPVRPTAESTATGTP